MFVLFCVLMCVYVLVRMYHARMSMFLFAVYFILYLYGI
jgi:hypothetical protein